MHHVLNYKISLKKKYNFFKNRQNEIKKLREIQKLKRKLKKNFFAVFQKV